MTKRYDDPIEVMTDPSEANAPLSFAWRGRSYEIDLRLATWREAGEWWLAAGRAASSNGRSANGRAARDREYHRVLARPAGAMATGDLDPDGFMHHVGAVYDLYLDRVARTWKLARVWD